MTTSPRRVATLLGGILLLLAPSLVAQNLVRRWTDVRNNVTGGGEEEYESKMTLDSAGNAFTAGRSNDRRKQNLIIRKIDSVTGAAVWERAYEIAGSTTQIVAALATDQGGNVFVTGSVYSGTNNADGYVAKFAAATGQLLWQARYNGPANGNDIPVQIAVDSSGDPVVISSSGNGSGTFGGNADLHAMKLNAATGSIRWQRRVSGSAGSASGRDVAIRPNGNVVVTGQLANNTTGGDIYLAEYAATNGAIIWQNTYNSTNNATDQVADLTLDSAGNAAVTGFAVLQPNGRNEMLTLKYSATGVLQWERRLTSDSPAGDKSGINIAADSAGDIFVFGYTTPTRFNSATQRYLAKYAAATGAVLWTQNADSFESITDFGLKHLALDAAGNPCITGSGYDSSSRQTFFTGKYGNASGAKLWENAYTWQTGTATQQVRHIAYYIGIDATGNVYAHGLSTNPQLYGPDQFTVKYAPANGAILWTNRYDGPYSREDGPGGVALDAAGDVLSTGYEFNPLDGENDLVVRKQNGKTGEALWKYTYHGPSGMEDEGEVIAADSKGDAFVAGSTLQFVGGVGQYALYFAKHSGTNGSPLWKVPVTTTDSRYLVVAAIAVGADDNPVMALSGSLSNDTDMILMKFSGATGAVLWRQSYSVVVPYNSASPKALVLDAAGNPIVAMNAVETGNFTGDIRTVKYSAANGSKIREMIYNGPGTGGDSVSGVAVDAAGNIAITGYQSMVGGDQAMFTTRYRASDGTVAWTQVYTGPDGTSAAGSAIAMDAQGNVLATGRGRERVLPVYSYDCYTAKYGAEDGALKWEKIHANAVGGDDLSEEIVVDSKGDVTVAGYTGEDTNGSTGYYSLFTVKYAGANGAALGSDLYASHLLRYAMPTRSGLSMAIGTGDRIVIGGYSRTSKDTDYDVATLMYEPQQPKLVLEYPAGQALAANAKVDFGHVAAGVPASFSFTIRNSGTANLTLGQFSLAGDTAAYEFTPPASNTVAGAGATGFSVRAVSGMVGPHAATLTIPSNDPDTPSFTVQLAYLTPSQNADLASLVPDSGALSPAFSAAGLSYRLTVPAASAALRLTPVTADATASVSVAGAHVNSGAASAPVQLPVGTTALHTVVTAQDPRFTRDYVIQVTRLPELITYTTGAEVPISADGFVVGANRVDFALGYAPLPGTTLTVVLNTGTEFIEGRFSNLEQGQVITLDFGGRSYRFVANYYGGNGNDLILQWADTAAAGWGANANGQLGEGDGSKVPWLLPAAIEGLPTGNTVFSLATGCLHSLCLTSDGVISAWGSNSFGQLGDGTKLSRPTPEPVSATGALAGKRVIGIAAGAFHSLALCSDGTVYAWGYNNHGQLGNGSTVLATEPVAVDASGVLAGKTVVAISAGAYHSLALCSDGSVAAWGFNGCGCLGNGSTTGSSVPVNVLLPGGGLLRAKHLSAGQYHNLAIRADGQLFAWGYNNHGQLGTGTTTAATTATALNILPDARPATAIAAGGYHSLALFDDGSLAEWGLDVDGSDGDLLFPVRVPPSGVLAGKQIAGLTAGADYSMALASDASVTAWGSNLQGQLGTGDMEPGGSPRSVLIPEGLGSLGTLARGSSASHTLTLLGLPLPPLALQSGAGDVTPLSITGWRQQHFDTADNNGDAANEADPDHDGLVNLLEYAFALDPKRPDASGLPQHRIESGHLVIEFVEPAGVIGVTYAASTQRKLHGAPWLPLADEGISPRHLFRIPMDREAGFIRLEVTSP